VNLKSDLVWVGILAGAGLLFPLVFRDAALLSVLAIMFIWIGLNTSWNLVLGFAGTFSFGQVAFFAAGGYAGAILNVHFGLSPWLDTMASIGVGGLAALLIGLAVLRLRGIYVALVTLAFHELLSSLISNDYSGVTGGPNGLTPIAPFIESNSLFAQSLIGYIIGLVAAVLMTVAVLLLIRSPVGLALVAARDAEHVAAARGVVAWRYRLLAFTFSGAVAGLMGGIYAHYVGVLSPSLFNFGLLMTLFAMIVVGGWGTIWGPVVGTIVMTILAEYVQGSFAQYQSLILAAILVLAVLFLPGGIVAASRPAVRQLVDAWHRA
jgi:branched-chain amino acid transport system permease protein